MKEYAVTNEMIRDLIQQLPNVFDSHDVIERIMQKHPQQYTMDLFSFVAKDDPIHSLHASIGQRLLGFDSIEKTEKVPSTNVRGNDTDNQEWRRK